MCSCADRIRDNLTNAGSTKRHKGQWGEGKRRKQNGTKFCFCFILASGFRLADPYPDQDQRHRISSLAGLRKQAALPFPATPDNFPQNPSITHSVISSLFEMCFWGSQGLCNSTICCGLQLWVWPSDSLCPPYPLLLDQHQFTGWRMADDWKYKRILLTGGTSGLQPLLDSYLISAPQTVHSCKQGKLMGLFIYKLISRLVVLLFILLSKRDFFPSSLPHSLHHISLHVLQTVMIVLKALRLFSFSTPNDKKTLHNCFHHCLCMLLLLLPGFIYHHIRIFPLFSFSLTLEKSSTAPLRTANQI